MKKPISFLSVLIFGLLVFSIASGFESAKPQAETRIQPGVFQTKPAKPVLKPPVLQGTVNYLSNQTPLMGRADYKRVALNEEYYFILDRTYGIYEMIAQINRYPHIENEYDFFSTIYREDPLIEQLLTSIDPNYQNNLNRKLSDIEKWSIIKQAVIWLINHAGALGDKMDLLAQAQYFADTGLVNKPSCTYTAATIYSLLLRLGIPRSDLAVAQVQASTYRNDAGEPDPALYIANGLISSVEELPEYLATMGGHYFAIARFGSVWFPIDDYPKNFPDAPTSLAGIHSVDYRYPFRVFIPPRKESCSSVLEAGCYKGPLGVPLVTVIPD